MTTSSAAVTDCAIDSAVAIVPARGGSRGVPGKNLAIVGDRTLLQRAIEACRGATSVSFCAVTTDDIAIGAVAEKHGAVVVWRPHALATDAATSESAVMHALDHMESESLMLPSYAIMVQCTSPFVSSGDLDAVARAMAIDGADCSFTASRSHRFLWRVDREGEAAAVNHDPRRRRPRQDLEPEFVETGAAYGFRIDGFRENQNRFFGRVAIAETDVWRTLEIDDPFDLTLARTLAIQIES